MLKSQLELKQQASTNRNVAKGSYIAGASQSQLQNQRIIAYTSTKLSSSQLATLQSSGIEIEQESFVPDDDDDGGSYYATAPVDEIETLAGTNGIERLTSAENRYSLLLNESTSPVRSNATNQVTIGGTSLNGSGARVAVIDTGVDDTHDALQGSIVARDDFAFGNGVNDVNGHGTHVAGIIGSDNETYTGVSPGADIIALDVADPTLQGYRFRNIGQAVIDAVDQHDADVISISLRTGGDIASHRTGESRIAEAVNYAVDQGATVVVSAGNAGDDDRHARAIVPAGELHNVTLDVQNQGAGALSLVREHPHDLNMTVYESGAELQPGPLLTYEDDAGAAIDDKGYWHDELIYRNFDPVETYEVEIENNDNEAVAYDLYYRGTDAHFEDNVSSARTLTEPATAEGAIAVGSYTSRDTWTDNRGNQHQFDNEGTLTSFSSRGPTVDGRTKPDVIAPGSMIISASSSDAAAQYQQRFVINDGNNGNFEDGWVAKPGTSMAAPHVSGEAALLVQQYREIYGHDPSPQVVRALITQSTTELGDHTQLASGMNNQTGSGLINTYFAHLAFATSDSITGETETLEIGIPDEADTASLPMRADLLVNQTVTCNHGPVNGDDCYDAVSSDNFSLQVGAVSATEHAVKELISPTVSAGTSEDLEVDTSGNIGQATWSIASTYPPIADASPQLDTRDIHDFNTLQGTALNPDQNAAYAVPVAQPTPSGSFMSHSVRALAYWSGTSGDIDIHYKDETGDLVSQSTVDPGIPAAQIIADSSQGGHKLVYEPDGLSGTTEFTPVTNYPIEPLPTNATVEIGDGNAGNASAPGTVAFNVTVQNANKPYTYQGFGTPNASHFTVQVGSRLVRTSNITLSQVNNRQDKYNLVFTAPMQRSPGKYNLSVAFTDQKYGVAHTAIAKEPDAIQYTKGGGTGGRTATSLIIDGSGSMGGTPISDAKDAAKEYVAIANANDEIGVARFDSGASSAFSMALVGGNESAMKAAIDGLNAGGSTNIGGGLNVGLSQLSNTTNGTNKAAVLLSDGNHNTGPNPKQVANKYKNRGIPVYTIALGGADRALLQDVASKTGGKMKTTSDSSALQDIYFEVSNTVTQASLINSTFGIIPINGSIINPFSVTQGTTSATVRVDIGSSTSGSAFTPRSAGIAGSNQSSLPQVRLHYPNGTHVPYNTTGGVTVEDDGISYSEVGDTVLYQIDNPDAGEWSYSIVNNQSTNTTYDATVTGDAAATLSVTTDANTYVNGSKAKIDAQLVDRSGGVTGATVRANVTLPNGNHTTVTLSEQRAGLYSGTVQNPEPGRVTATIKADRGNISREETVSWSVTQKSSLIQVEKTTTSPNGTQGGVISVGLNVSQPANAGTSTAAGTSAAGSGATDFEDAAREIAQSAPGTYNETAVDPAVKQAAAVLENESERERETNNTTNASTSAALAASGANSATNAYITASALTGPNGTTIPAKHVQVTDPVVPLQPGDNQTVLTNVSVPVNTKPGNYTGEVRIAANGEVVTAQITVEVTNATTQTFIVRIQKAHTKWEGAGNAGKDYYEGEIADSLTGAYFGNVSFDDQSAVTSTKQGNTKMKAEES